MVALLFVTICEEKARGCKGRGTWVRMGENFRKFSKSAPTLTIVPTKRGVGVVTTKSGCGPFALLWYRKRSGYWLKLLFFVTSGPCLPLLPITKTAVLALFWVTICEEKTRGCKVGLFFSFGSFQGGDKTREERAGHALSLVPYNLFIVSWFVLKSFRKCFPIVFEFFK